MLGYFLVVCITVVRVCVSGCWCIFNIAPSRECNLNIHEKSTVGGKRLTHMHSLRSTKPFDAINGVVKLHLGEHLVRP